MNACPSCTDVMTGGVLSILKPLIVALALFPARSVAFPNADWFSPSWVSTILGGHEATPERPSTQSKCTVTSALFQPKVLGPGVLEPIITGAVLSMLIPPRVVEAELPALSVHVPVAVWPLPS